MTDSTDEDAVCFVRSQQIGKTESKGESLGSKGVCVGAENVEEGVDRAANITMEERAVGRICDEMRAGGDSAIEGCLEIVEETSETQCEGVVGDVAEPSASDSPEHGSQPIRKVAGFGEVDTDDSADDNRSEGSGAASLDKDGTCSDDDALSVHSSGSDARHDLDYLHDQSGGLHNYLLMTS